ncbi:MAG: hypothetical protein EOP88_10555 [Verrucomicrobiaceae bacterium]|nr:MAG: hypothetical protein EOP88_10555 [Verrucomicrobiaceae bacterium]
MAGQADPARTVFYEYTPPKPRNPEMKLGWLFAAIAFIAAGLPFTGIGLYFVGILLCIAGCATGCVGISRGARLTGAALTLACLAAVPAGISISPWIAAFFSALLA